MQNNDIMKMERVLPEDFNGVFEFTNWTDEEFIGKWGGKEYRFPPQSRSPMLIPEHSPIEVQNIRKKFAKDLAEREFFKTPKYEVLRLREGVKDELGMVQPRAQGMSHAGQYTLVDLVPFIQKCLEPLPIKKATVTVAPKPNVEENLTRNKHGQLNSEAIDETVSLVDRAYRAEAPKQ